MGIKYVKGSETSLAAAEALKLANTKRGRVYRAIHISGRLGATDEELQGRLNMNPSTQRPRRVELIELGVIEPAPFTRQTASNRAARVWVIPGLHEEPTGQQGLL
jgi:hypothetical protein